MTNCSIFQIYCFPDTFNVFEQIFLKVYAEDLACTPWGIVCLGRYTEQTRWPRNPGILQLLGETVVHIWELLEAAVAIVIALLVASEDGIAGNKDSESVIISLGSFCWFEDSC